MLQAWHALTLEVEVAFWMEYPSTVGFLVAGLLGFVGTQSPSAAVSPPAPESYPLEL